MPTVRVAVFDLGSSSFHLMVVDATRAGLLVPVLRRRSFLVRQRALLIAHIQNEASQYNLPAFTKKLTYAANREELDVAGHFADPSVKLSIQTDLTLIDAYDRQLGEVELYLQRHAKIDDELLAALERWELLGAR